MVHLVLRPLAVQMLHFILMRYDIYGCDKMEACEKMDECVQMDVKRWMDVIR